MRTAFLLKLSLAVLLLGASNGRADPDLRDTRLLTQPAVSAKHVAFIYADDLWVADLNGQNVRRLTSDTGAEMSPVFSPDGQTIAFTAEYEGNLDVYTIPVTGGPPKRLTWHPSPDLVRGFTPDGKSILFTSSRHVFTNRYTQLFTVPLTGGMPTQLPIPHAADACYSPDGASIAYTPLGDRTQQWKHYRGGTHSRIWIYRCEDHSVVQVPQPRGRCNDLSPRWLGDTIYFLSDREGEYNLFAYDTESRKVRQLTERPQPFLYLPLAQNFAPDVSLLVRTADQPRRVEAPLRALVSRLDPDLPLAGVRTLEEMVSGRALLLPRLSAQLAGVFASLAVLLAVIGLYGVIAYSVGQRTREIGIRMALGARTAAVVGMVLKSGMRLAAIGLALGVVLAFGATRLLSGMLYGISAADPLTYVVVTLLLVIVTAVACLVPARRATQVDPLVALRTE